MLLSNLEQNTIESRFFSNKKEMILAAPWVGLGQHWSNCLNEHNWLTDWLTDWSLTVTAH